MAIEKMVRLIEIEAEMEHAQTDKRNRADAERLRRENEERDAEIIFEVSLCSLSPYIDFVLDRRGGSSCEKLSEWLTIIECETMNRWNYFLKSRSPL